MGVRRPSPPPGDSGYEGPEQARPNPPPEPPVDRERMLRIEQKNPTLRDRFALAAFGPAFAAFCHDRGEKWISADEFAESVWDVVDAMLRKRSEP